jgi:hypothetical protein
MDDLAPVALLCALGTLAVLLSGMGISGPLGIPFALALFALSLCGYFALSYLHGSGVETPAAEMAYMAAVIGAYVAAVLAFGALGVLFRFAFIPTLLCIPAIHAAVKKAI